MSDSVVKTNKCRLKVFVIVGGPGSGRITLSKMLNAKFKWEIKSMGELLKRYANDSNYVDNAVIKSCITKNVLVPEKITMSLFNSMISAHREKVGESSIEPIILDGYPRTLEQYITLIGNPRMKLMGGIILSVHPEVLVARCVKKNYKAGRMAEAKEIFEKRLLNYQNITSRMIEQLIHNPKFMSIENNKSLDETFNKISNIFETISKLDE